MGFGEEGLGRDRSERAFDATCENTNNHHNSGDYPSDDQPHTAEVGHAVSETIAR